MTKDSNSADTQTGTEKNRPMNTYNKELNLYSVPHSTADEPNCINKTCKVGKLETTPITKYLNEFQMTFLYSTTADEPN